MVPTSSTCAQQMLVPELEVHAAGTCAELLYLTRGHALWHWHVAEW